jgi:signal transduction histidine kinase
VGVSSWAGLERPRATGRSIRFTFIARVLAPAAFLVLLWALTVGVTVASGAAGRGALAADHREQVELWLIAGGGLVVLLAVLILAGSFASRLAREVRGLAATAQDLGDGQLPQPPTRSRGGEHAARPDGGSVRLRGTTAELDLAAAAIAGLQRMAAGAAVGEASLRTGLRQVFISLARRNQSLLHRQLRLIDALERKASDPEALADLFALDHLTTRMRRQTDSLTILSGAALGRSWSEPVPVIDVIRGAMAEVEDYQRVTVLTRAEDAVNGSAVADMIHLLAELIENATLFSPSGTRVEVRAERVANGFAIEIDDRGLGIEPDQLGEINAQLASPPDFDLANADQLGLFVGGKLAARHGVRVSLRPSPYGGTTAIVLLPEGIVGPAPEPHADAWSGDLWAPGGSAGLDRPAADVVALAGWHPAPLPGAAPLGAVPPGPAPLPVPPGPTPLSVPLPAPVSLTAAAAFTGPAAERQHRSAQDDGSLASQSVSGAYRGLPRRTRQASLSPHLRGSGLPAAVRPGMPEPEPVASAAPTPERARDLAASLQGGWRRGRQEDASAARPATHKAAPWPGGAQAPTTEEA